MLIEKTKPTLPAFLAGGIRSVYDFQFISSLFPPHRDRRPHSYPGDFKTNSPETRFIGHSCTKELMCE
jgi:hypothetical protein